MPSGSTVGLYESTKHLPTTAVPAPVAAAALVAVEATMTLKEAEAAEDMVAEVTVRLTPSK
jgi:hypothetical protein